MPILQFCSRQLDLSVRTHIMGILNVTPDSFSDGGRYDAIGKAVERAVQIQEEGADILDIGGQSTRPGHTPISAEEEWQRIQPVLEALRGRVTIPISVDTYYREVAVRALEAGAQILNDVSGSMDNGMPQVAAQYSAALVMMHGGNGADAEDSADAINEVRRYFEQALELAERVGLPRQSVCLDPGIGFGKPRMGDLELIARLPDLRLGLPDVALLVGASRKRVVGMCCGNPPFSERLPGTLAIHTLAQWNGANILRVHDVAAAVQAARVTDAAREKQR